MATSFRAAERAVLVATDVAARGLDIPGMDHVIHYHLPRAVDTYVHRSGRTARVRCGAVHATGSGGIARLTLFSS